LPVQIKTALFRVAQEALTNTIKHAEARNVWITLERGDKVISLEIRDDGKGFERSRVPTKKRPTWGLMGMQERAILCGGEFTLNTAPGWGTTVHVSIPCDQEVLEVVDDDNQIIVSG
jgi:two-component system sensor histidine kinase DegS